MPIYEKLGPYYRGPSGIERPLTGKTYRVTSFAELQDVFNEIEDYDIIVLLNNIYMESALNIPPVCGVSIIGNGFSFVRGVSNPIFTQPSSAPQPSAWKFYQVVFRNPRGKFEYIDSNHIKLVTQDYQWPDHSLAGHYILFDDAYVMPYYVNQISDNVGDTITTVNSISYDSQAPFYTILNTTPYNYFDLAQRFNYIEFHQCTFRFNHGDLFYCGRWDMGIFDWYFEGCVFRGRFSHVINGSACYVTMIGNRFVYKHLTDASLFRPENLLRIKGGWAHTNIFAHNTVATIGYPIWEGPVIYYQDEAGSGASMFVYSNWFHIGNFASSNYIVDLYPTSAGSTWRERIIRENYYQTSTGNLAGFVRDYNGGNIYGSIDDNYGF